MKLAAIFACLVASAYASPLLFVQQHTSNAMHTLSHSEEEEDQKPNRLIQFSLEEAPVLLSQREINLLTWRRVPFMDVTDEDFSIQSLMAPTPIALPTELTQEDKVRPLLQRIQPQRMRQTLDAFTAFHNRYFKSETGKEAAEWLFSTLQQVIADAGETRPVSGRVVTVQKHRHAQFQQPSLILTVKNEADDEKPVETVIVSAHLDSTAGFLPQRSRAPGADDDGSGSVTVLEAVRVLLLESDFVPRPGRQVEFHWYAAEEGGLLGSQDVAQSYRKANREIVSQHQIDMDGYPGSEGSKPSIALVTDFTSSDVTAFLGKLIEQYCSIPASYTKCSYACSDHASWNKVGYPSSFTIETVFSDTSKRIHSDRDTPEYLDYSHMAEYAKLVLGEVFELAA